MTPLGGLEFKNRKVERTAFDTLKKCYDKDISIPVDIELVAEMSGFITAHFITSRNRVFNTKNGPSGRL